MKREEIKSDREKIKDLKAIDFLLSHCGCLFFGDCGVSKGLRWIFSGKEPGRGGGGTPNLDSPTSYLWRIPTETTRSLGFRAAPLFIGSNERKNKDGRRY